MANVVAKRKIGMINIYDIEVDKVEERVAREHGIDTKGYTQRVTAAEACQKINNEALKVRKVRNHSS